MGAAANCKKLMSYFLSTRSSVSEALIQLLKRETHMGARLP